MAREVLETVRVLTSSRVEALLTEIRDELRAMRREQRSLQTDVSDPADRDLLLRIRESIADRPFTAAGLLLHATADPSLSAALLAADVTDAHSLGLWCRRVSGASLDALQLDRAGRGHDGRRWRVTL